MALTLGGLVSSLTSTSSTVTSTTREVWVGGDNADWGSCGCHKAPRCHPKCHKPKSCGCD
jgi:hypothetical protein